jgi:hypothetical protein
MLSPCGLVRGSSGGSMGFKWFGPNIIKPICPSTVVRTNVVRDMIGWQRHPKFLEQNRPFSRPRRVDDYQEAESI